MQPPTRRSAHGPPPAVGCGRGYAGGYDGGSRGGYEGRYGGGREAGAPPHFDTRAHPAMGDGEGLACYLPRVEERWRGSRVERSYMREGERGGGSGWCPNGCMEGSCFGGATHSAAVYKRRGF